MTAPLPLSTSLSAPLHCTQACFSLLNKEEKFNSFLWFTWRVALVEIALLATALEPKPTRKEASRSPAPPPPGTLRPVPRPPKPSDHRLLTVGPAGRRPLTTTLWVAWKR